MNDQNEIRYELELRRDNYGNYNGVITKFGPYNDILKTNVMDRHEFHRSKSFGMTMTLAREYMIIQAREWMRNDRIPPVPDHEIIDITNY